MCGLAICMQPRPEILFKLFAWPVFHVAWATGHRKYGQGCFDTSACPISQDSWRTGVGDNQKRPNSGIASDQVVLQHTGAKGRVFTCVALATPDHARRLFTLMCFQCPMAVASNVWLSLSHILNVASPQTCSRKRLHWRCQVR